MSVNKHDPVSEYQDIKPVYDDFALKLNLLLKDILHNNDIKYHLVESRAKDVRSFKDKITRKSHKYSDPVKEITDLCGCRVILYYRDDIDRVASLIKSNFDIFEENLTRQPESLEADRFGYLSAHYLIKIGEKRSDLIEWSRYKGLTAEIQIRTVVEHAWSAISHAVQYKQEAGVPSKLQRKLNRLAGLFEIADDEFVAIRQEREAAVVAAKQEISKGSKDIQLTSTSMEEYIKKWNEENNAVGFAAEIGFDTSHSIEGNELRLLYDICQLIGVKTIDQLAGYLNPFNKNYLERLYQANTKTNGTVWGVDLGFIAGLMLISKNGDKVTVGFLTDHGFDKDIANRVISAIHG